MPFVPLKVKIFSHLMYLYRYLCMFKSLLGVNRISKNSNSPRVKIKVYEVSFLNFKRLNRHNFSQWHHHPHQKYYLMLPKFSLPKYTFLHSATLVTWTARYVSFSVSHKDYHKVSSFSYFALFICLQTSL